MIHERSPLAIAVFLVFVGATLGLSFWLGRKAKSSQGYFAAHGQIPWFVNGVAFAGDYLSAASFLGICGLIAFYGYDGFLYSIGYLAGWIVALFVIAEPMKRLGKFTFADALDAKFGSRGIKLAAGVSTLIVSLFYLIPQMVGAGTLVKPLLGLDHATGVILVGVVVITIVVTAGMVSTTWVQFIKGTLLVVLCSVLTVMILIRGHWGGGALPPQRDDEAGAGAGVELFHESIAKQWPQMFSKWVAALQTGNVEGDPGTELPESGAWAGRPYRRFLHADSQRLVVIRTDVSGNYAACQTVQTRSGTRWINGRPEVKGENELRPVGQIFRLPGDISATGPIGPVAYLSTLQDSQIVTWGKETLPDDDGAPITVFYPQIKPGADLLMPGESPTFAGLKSGTLTDRLDFISLMLALFAGTASLPHILIRYYTVKDEHAARMSTVVGIFAIGFFYILTLYLGLSAMTSLVLDPTDSNMAAPLLARNFGELMFAAVSAVAFTTVLGTVSGLILAASGAVAHDLLAHGFGWAMTDYEKVRIAKFAAIVVGLLGIGLGIMFREFNVTFLVGWAFNIAASANLPALVMLLFWPRTTRQGIVAAIIVGTSTSLAWVLLSGPAYVNLYGKSAGDALAPFSQPGLVTIPLGFLTLIAVSLATPPRGDAVSEREDDALPA
ncbi:MAG: cation acetate symporter [Planctomyces sp.]|nr:cation acetate symporter [Planctomyces sp.]